MSATEPRGSDWRFAGLIAAGLCLAGLIAHAAPPSATGSFAAYPTQAQMQSAITSMQSTIMAAMPQPASTVPGMEAVGGAAGSASTYRRGDAVQPRITRSTTVTLDATGAATFDWTAQGALSTPVQVVTTPVYSGAGTPSCWPTAVSATSASIKCAIGSSVTLTSSALTAAGVGGITLNPFSAAPSGMSVGVIALPKS